MRSYETITEIRSQPIGIVHGARNCERDWIKREFFEGYCELEGLCYRYRLK